MAGINMIMDAVVTSAPINESIWAVHTSVTGSIITALLYGVVFLVGALLNPIIIGVIVVKKRLREPSFIFLFCLALVDFSEVFLSTPFYIATHIGREWIIGTTDEEKRDTCEMVGFFVTLFLSVSVHILALIAFDRFFYIVFAVKYRKFLKQWVAWLLVLSVILICVIISSPPLYGFGELFFFQTAGACLFRWRGGSNYRYVLFYSVEVFIPISVIFLFTLITFCYIKRHLHKRNKRQLEWTTKNHKVKPKVAVLNRIFGLLLVTQIICFGPALSTVLVGAIISFENVPDVVLLIDLILVLSNGAINPVIQAIVWKQVRTVMCKSCCKTTKMESPESSKDQVYNRQLTTIASVDDSLKVSVEPDRSEALHTNFTK